jgi:hypothetical protein
LAVKLPGRGLLGAVSRFERQYGPTLAALLALHNGDVEWVRKMAVRNFGRIKAKHRALLDEADEHLRVCGDCRVVVGLAS